jgi:hypothetical protein
LSYPDGVLLNIVRSQSAKEAKTQKYDSYSRNLVQSGVVQYFVCDNAKYVFGVEKRKEVI